MTALDAALAIGVLVQLTKLADVLLRPHQQKWVQDKCETLALALSEMKRVDLYGMASETGWLQRAEGVVSATFSYVYVNAFLRNLLDNDPFVRGVVTIVLVVVFGFAGSLAKRPFHQRLRDIKRGIRAREGRRPLTRLEDELLELLLRKEAELSGSRRRIRDALAGAAVLSILWAISHLTAYASRSIRSTILVLFISTSPFIGAWFGLAFRSSALGALTVLYGAFSKCLSLFLAAFRGVVWRIVEYNKGAWAAITMLVTFAVGVADVYVKSMPASDVKSEVTLGDPAHHTGPKSATATAAPVTTKP